MSKLGTYAELREYGGVGVNINTLNRIKCTKEEWAQMVKNKQVPEIIPKKKEGGLRRFVK